MKGLRPIRTVRDLKQYLDTCPDTAEVTIVPEEGDGFSISGVLEFSALGNAPAQVWLLMDEFEHMREGDGEEDPVAWTGAHLCGLERPGDPHCVAGDEMDQSKAVVVMEKQEPVDVVKVRGKLRSA
jgi:hypothetical protein